MRRSSQFLIDLRDQIAEYQKTKDKAVFHNILRKTDNLIVTTVLKWKQRRGYLKRVEGQELYHIGVVAMQDAITKMPADEDPNKVPAWIVAYIKARLKSLFQHREKEFPSERKDWSPLSIERNEPDVASLMIVAEYEEIVATGVLSEKEDLLLRERILEGRLLREIAKDRGVTDSYISAKLHRIYNKLRRFIRKKAKLKERKLR